MKKLPKQDYTAQFKELAVKRVKEGKASGGTARELGLSEQTLHNWVKAFDAGKLAGAGVKSAHHDRIAQTWLPSEQGEGRRLMHENDIRGRHKRRYKAKTDSRHNLPVAPNLLDRKFTPATPNRIWTADLTYIWTDEGLAVSGGRARSVQPGSGGIIEQAESDNGHRDRCADHGVVPPKAGGGVDASLRPGSQYASYAFPERLKLYGMVCSMGRKGNCWDNAPTENFFNSLKNERVHGTRYRTRAEAIADLFHCIEPFYNRRRLHSSLGYASPRNFLAGWISNQHAQKLAA